MSSILNFFAAVPKGMETVLAAELRELGAEAVDPGRAGVAFRGDLRTGYRACLWSRTASRILLPLTRFPAPTPEALYDGIRTLRWDEHLAPDGTLAVEFNTGQSQITHSQFGAQKVKDAVVDQFRDRYGRRPAVDRARPDLRINVYLFRDQARVSLDLSGESLHRRGYREDGAAAPLKENLAAAILLLAGWPEIARGGGSFLDPMCGSGTLPIEAALIAGDTAPGLLRTYFGFLKWRGHDAAAWEELLAEARERRAAGSENRASILGSDLDPAALRSAQANLVRAGLHDRVEVEQRALEGTVPPVGPPGLVAVNPPYGERLGEERALIPLYVRLGEILRERFPGWRAAILTGNPRLELRLGLNPCRADSLYNGPLECRLLHFELTPSGVVGKEPFSPGGEMLANRLRKNLRHLGRWARRGGIDCFRLYDADLPEYALAIDLYQGAEGRWVHAQEYEAPATIDPEKAEERLREGVAVLPPVLEVAPENVFLKVRRRQRGSAQYERQGAGGAFCEVRENDCRYLVNFTDHLDTGLFLDHRPLRRMIRELAAGRRFLNLFGYTGTATVQAAAGGAAATVTVDLSKTYLEWARRNLALNGFGGPAHQLVQGDCLAWLAGETASGRLFDLILLDPPTFSTSKRMRGTFDVQRDHVALIRQAARLLAPGGILFFSTNLRSFRLDAAALTDLSPEDITRETIPEDFARSPRVHQVWKIVREG